MGLNEAELGTFSSDASRPLRRDKQPRKPQDGFERMKTFREKAKLLLESPKFHIIVLTLVIIELIMVVVELMIDASGIEKSEALETVEIALKYISISILSIFGIENLFTMYVLRCEFFHKCLEVFDFIVIFTSLVLEVIFLKHHDAATGVGILVGLRLWRIVRVINGITVTVAAQSEKKLEVERDLREEVEMELNKCVDCSKKQQCYISLLEKYIQSHGLEIPPNSSGPARNSSEGSNICTAFQ